MTYTNTYNEIYNAVCEIEEIINFHIEDYEDYLEHKPIITDHLNKIQEAIDVDYETRKALGGKLGNLVKELL